MFIALCSQEFEYEVTVAKTGEKRRLIFSATELGDLAKFVRYYKYLPYYELKEVINDFPEAERNGMLKDELRRCSLRKSQVKVALPAPVEKDEEGLPVKGADLNAKIYIDSERDFSFECPEVIEFSDSIEGHIYQLYLSALHKQPDITLDFIRGISPNDRNEIMTYLYELNGLIRSDDGSNSDEDVSKKKKAG